MIKKADIILSAILCILSVAIMIFSFAPKSEGKTAVVKVDNKVYAEYPLTADRKEVITTEYGVNTVVIKNGETFVSSADCPDGYCVKHTPADEVGETVVCLPHRLVIEIKE